MKGKREEEKRISCSPFPSSLSFSLFLISSVSISVPPLISRFLLTLHRQQIKSYLIVNESLFIFIEFPRFSEKFNKNNMLFVFSQWNET